MSTQHTPGRWVAVGHWVEHESDNVPDIANCDRVSMGQAWRSDAEICANARLIATAPELLRVLRLAVGNRGNPTVWRDAAIAAIEAAEGRPVEFGPSEPDE